MSRRIAMTLWTGLLLAGVGYASDKSLEPEDKVRIAEAYRLGAAVQEEVWPGWSRAPFHVLLIGENHEFLIGHPETPDGFEDLGIEETLGHRVGRRPRVFPPYLLATFPAVTSSPSIVIGLSPGTGKASTQWVVTMLHEHFHQLQMSETGYYAEIDGLDLARGDDTGMWMLEFPFPYEAPDVGRRFSELAQRLGDLLAEESVKESEKEVAGFWCGFEELLNMLEEDDAKYISFQLWQEGVARYVELKVAQRAATDYRASPAFRALPDFESFSDVARGLERDISEGLEGANLANDRRLAFYPVGAGMAMLLDRMGSEWRSLYLSEKFFLERYVDVDCSERRGDRSRER